MAVGLVLGGVIGWLIGSRRAAPADSRVEEELRQQRAAQDAELARLRTEVSQANSARAASDSAKASAEKQLADVTTRLTESQAQLNSLREEKSAATASLATASANCAAAEKRLAEQKRLHDEQLAALKQAQDKALADLREAFKALSADALKQTQPEFLRLANETMGKFAESAKGDLSQRQQAIATLVKPLEEQLKTYQQRLAQSETTQASALGEVKKHLESLAQHSQTLSSETLQLRRVLSSNQARGKWGEETLRRVVEAAGMSAHCDFSEQTQAGDSKPDLVVRLPGDRIIIVDAKVPDLDFLAALDAADEAKRAEALAAHARKLKDTIKALADRDYPAQFANSLDYVVLFVPAESLFSAALEGDRDLIVWAAGRRILLATPASLIALLRSVSVSWQQHAQTENAQKIAAAAQEFYSRMVKFTEHFEKIRAGLERANAAYNDAVGSYERMVRPSGERLKELGGIADGKELSEVTPLESTLRLT
ncbi:MAG: DNA recombination protein RmuC, partial [Verrucomicrobia bacterium]|nr:DNA recombination protein RmuC [Verrucomicrobiota bacterium]